VAVEVGFEPTEDFLDQPEAGGISRPPRLPPLWRRGPSVPNGGSKAGTQPLAGPARRRADANCRRRGRPRARRDYPARPETGGQVADD